MQSGHFGFMMITADPELASGGHGRALDLVRSRLTRRTWPLYRGTRCRTMILPGSLLMFYVGGHKECGGTIIATASVAAIRTRAGFRDDDAYCTTSADHVLSLRDVTYLAAPVNFRAILPSLSCCPANVRQWGPMMQGGCRGVSENDWRILTAPEA